MSSRKTSKLNLHAWEGTDPFKMVEFNENFEKIDQAVGDNAATLEKKADAGTVTALQSAVQGKADKSDLTALQSAVQGKADKSDLTALQNTVNGKANTSALNSVQSVLQSAIAQKVEIVTGTYDGDGAATRTINLGFKPRAVYLSNIYGQTCINTFYYGGLALPDAPVAYMQTNSAKYPVVEITNNGFQVHNQTVASISIVSNLANIPFRYIAFK